MRDVESIDFDLCLNPWLELFRCSEITGTIVSAALHSIRAFLHAGLLSTKESPLSRSFVAELVKYVAHCRFEPTTLDNDEVVMSLLVDVLLEFVRVTVESVNSESRCAKEEIIGETFLFEFMDLLFVLLNQTRFSELLRWKAVEAASEVCVLIFSCLRVFDSASAEIGEDRTNRITFPNIVKPHAKASDDAALIASQSLPESRKPSVNSSSAVTESANTSVVNVSELSAKLLEGDLPKDFDPFSLENVDADELAPGVMEEVQLFRARLAGEASMPNAAPVVDDLLSRHCINEILRFLLVSIDIIDENSAPRKAPGSIKAEPLPAVKPSNSPSIKTQTAALKCILCIFTDPLSELSQPPSFPLSQFFTDLVELIGDRLIKNLLGILTLDSSSRHLPILSQLLLVLFDNYRIFLPAQFEFFLTTCFNLISTRPYTSAVTSSSTSVGSSGTSTVSATLVKPIAKPALIALKLSCLEMLAYVRRENSVS